MVDLYRIATDAISKQTTPYNLLLCKLVLHKTQYNFNSQKTHHISFSRQVIEKRDVSWQKISDMVSNWLAIEQPIRNHDRSLASTLSNKLFSQFSSSCQFRWCSIGYHNFNEFLLPNSHIFNDCFSGKYGRKSSVLDHNKNNNASISTWCPKAFIFKI